ncbi:hypothetical protein MBCUT_09900 [Methanobrevibacter cuticularis]|uniref:Uncharacterized protein n=1 Tax=Methanobrevibacter cuticularis TaxID=47311 RepID=A0A166DZR3_9EURY|nr:hypothetical protein [Methanobrevibacter cuticularis]KZX16124.1 hypothetical protein MBCUT_09900 [Methanobrevibacter cuticularis]
MNRFVDKIISLELDEIEKYSFPRDELFGLKIIENGVKYEFLIKLSSYNNNLICFGSGAYKNSGPKATYPPIFNRWSWNKDFEESVLFYNDPTLYLNNEVKLGWGVGFKEDYYLEIISKIIKLFAKGNNISNNDILFYGSSGGGFTSIILATLIKKSKVFVNNSQLILKNYYHKNVYKRMIKACFGDLDIDTIYEKYGYRLSVLEMFKKEKYVPSIVYYVNSESKQDIINQCIPFVEGFLELPFLKDKVEIIFYTNNQRNKHNPLSNKKTIEIIKKVSKENLCNNKNENPKNPSTNENAISKKKIKKYISRKLINRGKLLKIKKLLKFNQE